MKRIGRLWLGFGAALGLLGAAPVWAADTVTYYYTDTLHSAVVETNAQGQVIQTAHYAPYGQVLNQSLQDGPGYTGHEEDPGTGLVYMQQRYYDPVAGRFLSVDPVAVTADGGGFNRYEYANDNPYRYTDPDGRQEADESAEDVEQLRQEIHPNLVPISPAEEARQQREQEVLGPLEAASLKAADPKTYAPKESLSKSYTTYTRTNAEGKVYSGRTSGKGTPEQQVQARTRSPDHQAKTRAGYGPAVVDRNSSNPDAIRGREQQLIEQHGGAQSQGGTSGNAINGVSPTNPKAAEYKQACTKETGC